MKIKGVYKFKIDAIDAEETVTFQGEHTWEEVQEKFIEWVYEYTGAEIEEISYEEKP